MVAGLPVAVPVLDIHTVGAGGGSIARVDDGGSLKVGPQSAGADPGPACYGKSDLATVTDAHLVLGHLPEAKLLGGDFDLDVERARLAMRRLADDMSRAACRKIPIEIAAEGVIAVVNNNMERALRGISIERGFDPRDFVLLPFGGAGGLHAFDLARALQIPRVVVPSAGGALSAIGVMTADVVQDLSRTVMMPAEQVDSSRKLERVFRELEHDASRRLKKEGFKKSQQRHQRFVAMRYLGQSFELDIEWIKGDLAKVFHRAHRVRYGYEQTANPVEIVSARLRSKGLTPPMQRERWPSGGSSRVRPHNVVSAWFAGKQVKTAVHQRERLLAGSKFRGPAIVTEYSATILVPPSGTARVDSYGNIIIDTV
jgi:N-methylhydantoinase A